MQNAAMGIDLLDCKEVVQPNWNNLAIDTADLANNTRV